MTLFCHSMTQLFLNLLYFFEVPLKKGTLEECVFVESAFKLQCYMHKNTLIHTAFSWNFAGWDYVNPNDFQVSCMFRLCWNCILKVPLFHHFPSTNTTSQRCPLPLWGFFVDLIIYLLLIFE